MNEGYGAVIPLDEKVKKIKFMFFDMEGTLFTKAVKNTHGIAASVWTKIAQELGPDALALEEMTKQKWNRGEYTGYIDWMRDTVLIHMAYSLKKDLFTKIVDDIEYNEGVERTVRMLHNKDIQTGLISGGFARQARKAAKELHINHYLAACDYFWDEKGYLSHWSLLPFDYKGKLDLMATLLRDLKLEKHEVGFVADGANDKYMAREVGLSIAYNAQQELKEASNFWLDGEDFSGILRFLAPHI